MNVQQRIRQRVKCRFKFVRFVRVDDNKLRRRKRRQDAFYLYRL